MRQRETTMVRAISDQRWPIGRTMPDAYTRRARIAPALLVGIPGAALLGASALSPEAALRAAGIVSGAILGAVESWWLCSYVTRGAGFNPGCGRARGGPPAQARLRWRDGGPRPAVARLHRRIEAVTGEPLPTQTAESADPDNAERQYDDAIGVLKERTRSADAFPLLAAENADYGFRRNTLGLRPLGLAVSLRRFRVSIAFLLLGHGELGSRADRWAPAAGACALSALFWWHVVRDGGVRNAANNYADRLLGAVDSLNTLTSGTAG